MRYILLGLSCSLTACLETETTQTQDQAQSNKAQTQEQTQKHSNEEKQEETFPEEALSESVEPEVTGFTQETTEEVQVDSYEDYFGGAQIIGAQAPPSPGSADEIFVEEIPPPTPANSTPESARIDDQNMDAGEGAKAKKEEGTIAVKKGKKVRTVGKVRATSQEVTIESFQSSALLRS